jgi:L-lactate utilization protein LutB
MKIYLVQERYTAVVYYYMADKEDAEFMAETIAKEKNIEMVIRERTLFYGRPPHYDYNEQEHGRE